MSREKAQELLCTRFGIELPYVKMGRIDSLHLFGDTELMIFAIYEHNVSRWTRVLDIGANIGLHSILLAKMGYVVKAYEPDWMHFEHLLANLKANNCEYVSPFMAAVHLSDGTANFVRVSNNLTGNHLEGYKASYGPRETLLVPTVDCRKLWSWPDLVKIDSEGNEAELCSTMTAENMRRMSCIVEVRSYSNAQDIYEHFSNIEVPMWSQKVEWARVTKFENMPQHNREGTLFIGYHGPWD